MKKLFFSICLCLSSLFCYAQKMNGDWKGTFNYPNSQWTGDLIFHIVDEYCSEELAQRSPADMKETLVDFTVKADSIYISTRKNGLFKGLFKAGKISGTIIVNNEETPVILKKIGKGKISEETNYRRINGNLIAY